MNDLGRHEALCLAPSPAAPTRPFCPDCNEDS
jgi:hypothetical protein